VPSILFVCSANQCRSPMAEVLFQELLQQKGKADDWRVESAGVWAYQGARATENAQIVIAERGLSLDDHRSQPADPALLKQFDLVIVMENRHKEVLQVEDPGLVDRVYLIRELAGEVGDFNDPVGGSLGVYRKAAGEIHTLLSEGWGEIQAHLMRSNPL